MAKKDTAKNRQIFLEAFKNKAGSVTAACRAVGISRKTFYEWKKKSSKFRDQVEMVEEELIDFAESALFKLIAEGNARSTIFFLKTRGKKRGYSEKYEAQKANAEDKNKANKQAPAAVIIIPDNGRDKIKSKKI